MAEAAVRQRSYPTKFEQVILQKADAWWKKVLPAGPGRRGADPVEPAPDPRLILLCMTPRSGSTALSAAMASTRRLGLGGDERLNQKNKVLNQILRETMPRSRREVLERVIEASRTPNGVAQIKCDLPQILPFLLDRDCFEILRQARVVYLTRGDLLGQAISRYRSSLSGVAHVRGAQDTAPVEVPYDFAGIAGHLERLARMMVSYERTFALLGIRPLRITYEQIVADPGRIVHEIAKKVGVDIRPGQIAGLEAGGHRRVGGSNNAALRARFLQDAFEQACSPPPRLRRAAERALIAR
jgi:LPS sulfotransferase NodH